MGRKRDGIFVYMNSEEFAAFEKAFAASSSPNRGIYARKLLFGKAIRIYYRDRAFDAFTDAGVQFNKDLKSLLAQGSFNDEERRRLVSFADDIKSILVKIDDHVRQTRKNRLPPGDA